jgi:hypothetical protein
MVDPRAGGPAVGAQAGAQGAVGPQGPQQGVAQQGMPQQGAPQQGVAQNGPQGPQGPAGTTGTDKPKETPVYKKWWFWAVVAVSAYVVISIATESSQNPNATGHEMLPSPGRAAASPGGLTLWRF